MDPKMRGGFEEESKKQKTKMNGIILHDTAKLYNTDNKCFLFFLNDNIAWIESVWTALVRLGQMEKEDEFPSSSSFSPFFTIGIDAFAKWMKRWNQLSHAPLSNR